VLATHQLIIGGLSLTAVGLAAGEVGQLGPESFAPGGVFAFFYLLIFGSLVGFLAYAWLLANVSTTLAGTYAYVNPVVALIAGAILAREPIGWAVVCGMGVILLGVALVRQGGVIKTPPHALARGNDLANQLSHELIDGRKSGATLVQPD
jgi:drug/metabolite transporter (DMT)-like permease